MTHRDTAEEALGEATATLDEAKRLSERGLDIHVDTVAAFTASVNVRLQVAIAAALLDLADAIRETRQT